MTKFIVTTCDRCGASTTATTQGDYLWIVMPDSSQRDVCPECAASCWEWWAEGSDDPPYLESREGTE